MDGKASSQAVDATAAALEPDGADRAYRETVRELSERLVEIQRPIRILDAIQWDEAVEAAFFRSGARELPAVDAEAYARRPLRFEPAAKRAELQDLEREVGRRLGQFNPVGGILRRMCGEYQAVVRMLESRGTPEFGRIAAELYGSASDVFHAGEPSLADLGTLMSEALENLERTELMEDEKDIPGAEAVALLQERLDRAFADTERRVRVVLSDGIVADASAGAQTLKIRSDALFSARDLRTLEVHEGWVHLGTTLNGLLQPVCTFLSKGPPSSTVTQEGLAILMELVSFSSHPARLRTLTRRIQAVDMAERGADFLDVFRFLREEGLAERDAYAQSVRVFRGSLPDAGPFTKDLSYAKGFVLLYNYLRLAVRRGLLAGIPMLFCGKANLEDVRILSELVAEGLVVPPRFLPPQIADLRALAAWMCFSNFLNKLSLQRIESDYAKIL